MALLLGQGGRFAKVCQLRAMKCGRIADIMAKGCCMVKKATRRQGCGAAADNARGNQGMTLGGVNGH
jgi:hypothetical protein